jgi:hypothetical protein
MANFITSKKYHLQFKLYEGQFRKLDYCPGRMVTWFVFWKESNWLNSEKKVEKGWSGVLLTHLPEKSFCVVDFSFGSLISLFLFFVSYSLLLLYPFHRPCVLPPLLAALLSSQGWNQKKCRGAHKTTPIFYQITDIWFLYP